MAITDGDSLPRFDPRHRSLFSRFRLLPAWALTIVSVAMGAFILVYLRWDATRLALFKLPYGATLWAAGATLAVTAVIFGCHNRPGSMKRVWLPQGWAVVLLTASSFLLFMSIARQPVPGHLQAAIYAACVSAAVLVFRLIRVQPLAHIARWIAVIVFVSAMPTGYAAMRLADSLVTETVGVAGNLEGLLKGRAAKLRDVAAAINDWSENTSVTQTNERLERIRQALSDVDSGIPPDVEIQRIVHLGEGATKPIRDAAAELMDAIEALARCPDEAGHLPTQHQSDRFSRMLDVRRTYFANLIPLVSAKSGSAELQRLAPLFGADAAGWQKRNEQLQAKIDADATRLESSWGTFWLGRALASRGSANNQLPSATPAALLNIAFTDKPVENGGSPDPTSPPRLQDLDRFVAMTLEETRRHARDGVLCLPEASQPALERAMCTPFAYRQPQRASILCTLRDASGSAPVRITFAYQSSGMTTETIPCNPDPADRIRPRQVFVYPGIGGRSRPARVDLEFAAPNDPARQDAFARALVEAFDDAITRSGGKINSSQSGSFSYQTRGQTITVTRVDGAPGTVTMRASGGSGKSSVGSAYTQ